MEIQKLIYLEGVLTAIIDSLKYILGIRNDIGFFHPDSVIAQKKRLEYYNEWVDYFTKIVLCMELAFVHAQHSRLIRIVNIKMKKI